jgi:hypothetical protein
MKSKQVLGVDIGNVIINHRLSNPNDKTLHDERYSTIPETEGVFDALKKLNQHFEENIYLISKCSEWAEKKILEWLNDNDFYNKTGINPEHIAFVRERHEKDAICRKFGITHFVDDRLEVLSHMIESTQNLFLYQPNPEEVKEFEKFLPKVTVVNSWDEIIKHIIK